MSGFDWIALGVAAVVAAGGGMALSLRLFLFLGFSRWPWYQQWATCCILVTLEVLLQPIGAALGRRLLP